MIQVGNWVLVKSKDDFPTAIVLEIANNDAGKRIYRIVHSLNVGHPSLDNGYWVDGSRVFEMDEQPKPEVTSNDASIASQGAMLLNRVQ
jgi:hypothetical protein